MANFCPKLRWPLETQRIEHHGKPFVLLRDPLAVAEDAVIIPEPLVAIVARFDGLHSIDDIVREGGAWGITRKLVVEMVEMLSANCFLDDEQFRQKHQRILGEFAALRTRPCVFANVIYPSDPAALEASIAEFRSNAQVRLAPHESRRIVAVASPHIDYLRGGKTYGYTSVLLDAVDRPDVIILLGTSHAPGHEKFILSQKGLETPFGTLPPATAIIEGLARRYGRERAFREEFLHRKEHSLELQLPFLGWRYRDEALPAVVPLLIGSFHDAVESGREPMEYGEVCDFVGALAEVLTQAFQGGQRVLLFAGIDLAHVGLHFGDSCAVAGNGLETIRQRDAELLAAVLRGDESALFAHIAEDQDARRICGFPSMYAMFAALRHAGVATVGTLVDYRQAVNAETDCIVTFASAYWTKH